MNARIRPRPLILVSLFGAGLVFLGLVRAAPAESALAALSGLATPLYVGLTILSAVLLIRAGAPFVRFGFERPFRPALHLGLAIGAIVVTRLASMLLDPVWETLLGEGRDLERFADVAGSPGALFGLLALSWSFAAFGEEIAFRIVLLRGLAFALGDGRCAWLLALGLQAVVFGLVHLYQGPAGVVGSAINGLIVGAVVLLARGSIWPAALAHGGSNTIGILSLYGGG